MKHSLRILALLTAVWAVDTLASSSDNKSMWVSIAVPVIGGVYSYTLDDVEGLRELGLGCLLTAQITTLLKYSVHRTRPDGSDNYSFPSGHTSAAFLGASYLHHRYGLVWGIPMYGIASAIGLQRVNVKSHYWTDVIAGAALGYTVAAFCTKQYPRAQITPIFDPANKTYGMQFTTSFG